MRVIRFLTYIKDCNIYNITSSIKIFFIVFKKIQDIQIIY